MEKKFTDFEVYMRNKVRKAKNIEDEKTLNEILEELKLKHQSQLKEKIEQHKNNINEIQKNIIS